MGRISRDFFVRPTHVVAYELLGKILLCSWQGNILGGIITETEAYTDIDPASHAYRGKTVANASLFGPVGHAYVYLSYGIHYCCNVVAFNNEQKAGGVLIRAVQPLYGIDLMARNRKKEFFSHNLSALTNGPGKVGQALAITRQLDGYDLITGTQLYLEDQGIIVSPDTIHTTERIGISKAKDTLYRFYVKDVLI